MLAGGTTGTAVRPAPAPEGLALPQDLFVIPDGDHFLVFAPFTLGVASVNAAAARRLQQVRDGSATLGVFGATVLNELAGAGILLPAEKARSRKPFPAKPRYDPEGMTLFLTTRCTLACTYCYASAGDRPRTMSWTTAETGLDWMFRHAAARQRDHVSIMFHGGGEATAAWSLMRRCVAYARRQAAARGMTLSVSAGLNGVMGGRMLEWILSHVDDATISLDGLPEVQNTQRPLRNGKGSFDVIAAVLRRMDEVGFKYGIRSTVTQSSLPTMVESVEFLCRTFRAPEVHLEPVFAAGRARVNDLSLADPLEFVRGFREAAVVARGYGRTLKYSGARFGTTTNRFCQVGDDLLTLTPDGLVSSCYEIGDLEDPRADLFIYGRVNPESHDLEIDASKVARLRALSVENKRSCDACFCRWSCAGECASKLALAGDPWDTSGSARCVINRELTLDQMRDYLELGGFPDEPPGLAPS